MLTINGAPSPEHIGQTLTEYLREAGLRPERVAVECNGEIIPKKEYDGKILEDGDSLEVVSFVGGG